MPAVARPADGHRDTAPRSPRRRPRCADPPAVRAVRVAVTARAAYRPTKPPAWRGWRRSARRHRSATDAATAPRTPDGHLPGLPARPHRTARCDADYPASNRRRTPVVRAGRTASPNNTEPPESWGFARA